MDKAYLSENLPQFNIYTFDAIDSTNLFAKTLTDDFALVVSNSQTNGRGRLGRDFISPPDTGIYMSILYKVEDMYRNIPYITTAVSVAVHKAISETASIKTGIKWVNDIYLGDKKVCGILCESADFERAVIGIGLNLLPNSLPPIATSLFKKTVPFRREDLIVAITKNLAEIFSLFPDSSFLNYYREHSIVLGKEISYTENGVTRFGKAVDIDSCGGLVVSTQAGHTTLSTGEISIRLSC